MTLIALTILLGALLLVANEYELRNRKERRRLECQEAVAYLEDKLGIVSPRERGLTLTSLNPARIAPGEAIYIQGKPADVYFHPNGRVYVRDENGRRHYRHQS